MIFATLDLLAKKDHSELRLYLNGASMNVPLTSRLRPIAHRYIDYMRIVDRGCDLKMHKNNYTGQQKKPHCG